MNTIGRFMERIEKYYIIGKYVPRVYVQDAKSSFHAKETC